MSKPPQIAWFSNGLLCDPPKAKRLRRAGKGANAHGLQQTKDAQSESRSASAETRITSASGTNIVGAIARRRAAKAEAHAQLPSAVV